MCSGGLRRTLEKGNVLTVLLYLQEEWPLLENYCPASWHLSLSPAGLLSCRRSSSHGQLQPRSAAAMVSRAHC